MKSARGAQAPEKTIIISGDMQAEAVSILMRADARINSQFKIVYANSADGTSIPSEKLARCAGVCEQQAQNAVSIGQAISPQCVHVRFPSLELGLLWPFNCTNPYDEPEPPDFSFGRFPYGDAFVVNCIDLDISPVDIMHLYLSGNWEATWPDLNMLYQSERMRLCALDDNSDIKIGSYILEHFRTERLFWTPKDPTNILLSELAQALLRACLGSSLKGGETTPDELLPPAEILGALSVPIHPGVARHFGLSWRDPEETYRYFNMREFSYMAYYENMIARSYFMKYRDRGQMAGSNDEPILADPMRISFTCNICGLLQSAKILNDLTRETGQCSFCGANVRLRALAHLVGNVFGGERTVPEWQRRKHIRVIGVSDWPDFGRRYSGKLTYVNTQFDRDQYRTQPFLDISNPSAEFVASADIITCSEVLEHVAPPVQRAFDGLYSMLKPGGTLILTVPYTHGQTIEHFPELHSWKLEKRKSRTILVNTTRTGQRQVFEQLCFHGGGATVLEMRVFGLTDIIEGLRRAGFDEIVVIGDDLLEFGIRFGSDIGRPITARRPKGHA